MKHSIVAFLGVLLCVAASCDASSGPQPQRALHQIEIGDLPLGGISLADAEADAVAVGGVINVAKTDTGTFAAPGVAASSSNSTSLSVGRRRLSTFLGGISVADAEADAAAVGGVINVAKTDTGTFAAPGVAASSSDSTSESVGRWRLWTFSPDSVSIAKASADATASGGDVNIASTTTKTSTAPGVAIASSSSTASSSGRRLLL